MAEFNIGQRNIRVGSQKFKDKWYIHIRQWFEKDGEMRPGKGIGLTVEEWNEFLSKLDEIKDAIIREVSE